jgi:tyrosine-protein kinase Etk/Wzc
MKLGWSRLPAPLRTPEMKRVGMATAAGILLAVSYAALAPRWYQSALSVVPTGAPKGGGSLGTQIAGALGAAIDMPELGVNVDVERIAAVFESTSVSDAVIRKFDLADKYGVRYPERARQVLWSHCSTSIDRKARIVSLACEDRDPRFVQQMLEFFGEHGNEVFRRVSATSASEEVRFLEQRVAEMRKEADESARRLREFEERHKIVDLDSQSKAVVSAMASLRGQEISKELQLSYMNTFSSRDEATAVQLRQQLAVMNAKFRKLEEPSGSADTVDAHKADPETSVSAVKGADIFPPAMSVPRLRFELEQLYRDKKIREADLLLLMQRLELAKVNEARDTSAFQILDHATVPAQPSRPNVGLVLISGLILGLFAGAAWAFGPSYVRALALFPDRNGKR